MATTGSHALMFSPNPCSLVFGRGRPEREFHGQLARRGLLAKAVAIAVAAPVRCHSRIKPK